MTEVINRAPRTTVVTGFVGCYYFHEVRKALGQEECSGTFLEREIDIELSKKGIKVGPGTNKYSRYESGSAIPAKKTLKQIEIIAPGTSEVMNMPLWQALKPTIKQEDFFDNFYKQLSPRFSNLFYAEGIYGPVRKEYKTKHTRVLLNTFSLEAFASLIAIYRELKSANKPQSQTRPIKSAIQCLLFYLSISTSLYYFRNELFDYITQELEIFSPDDALIRRLNIFEQNKETGAKKVTDTLSFWREYLDSTDRSQGDSELKEHILAQFNHSHPSNHKDRNNRLKEMYTFINLDEP